MSFDSNNNSSNANNGVPGTITFPAGGNPNVSLNQNDCFVTAKYGDLRALGVNGIISFFHKACRSPEFAGKCKGFTCPTFMPNYELIPGVSAVTKFQNALVGLPDQAELGVVFHGTPETNIHAISTGGLDPAKRKGQAYGPGEYFSKDPGVSVSYCRNGGKMLVFVVVLPPPPSSMQGANAPRHSSRPAAYVVVENNNHQLPIGTLAFSSVDHNVMMNSQQLQQKLLSLNKQVEDRIKAAEEAQIKAEIIQALIAGHVDLASETYIEYKDKFSELSRKEIAWYVQSLIGTDERFSVFFPDLPEPMDNTKLAHTMVQSVDYAIAHETQALYQLQVAQNALNKQKDEENKLDDMIANKKADNKKKLKVAAKRQRDTASSVISGIMQNLIKNRTDIASELYEKAERKSRLDGFAKREIAQCVYRLVDDKSLIPILFPDLPEPDTSSKKPC
ncbi:expressed unknown protein [Seminavis robusta]|uniref:PARP catalytic domain-containing protein n=1 Tax=Seminavis robusta TaxID=568900 RepID=A0A9N8DUX4_9STRA|nr:expressed unknown protein [Seminavis robusta]|eukprot:Sro390_g132840.1 n/a (447) ;mRNA; f:34296-35636